MPGRTERWSEPCASGSRQGRNRTDAQRPGAGSSGLAASALLPVAELTALRTPVAVEWRVRVQGHRGFVPLLGQGDLDVQRHTGRLGVLARSLMSEPCRTPTRSGSDAASLRIARQSILAGMGLSIIAMGFAAFGFIAPVAGALLQEAIDLGVILNALRALKPGRGERTG